MTIAAGIDVGNSSTEVVLARVGAGGADVIGAARAPTRRLKGSPESLDGAVALVRRLERQHGVRVQFAAAAHLRPVETVTATVPQPRVSTGRLAVVRAGASTTGGLGFGTGRPWAVGTPAPRHGLVVAVVPAGTGYRAAANALAPLVGSGRVTAVVVEDDEAVLVSHRLGASVPVIDEVDAAAVLGARLVAVEVTHPGSSLRTLTDPLRLATQLGLEPYERQDAARLAAQLHDTSNAVVVMHAAPPAERPLPAGWVDVGDGRRLPLPAAAPVIARGRVGLARSYALPPDRVPAAVDDLWTVDLSSVADAVVARRGVAGSRAIGLAALRRDAPLSDPTAGLAERLGVTVRVEDESRAARAGALTTPGAGEGLVIDVGGGTIDAVSPDRAVVAGGGGDLLTASVAILTGTTSAAAEWVKRGAAHRVEAPQMLLAETGDREFLDRPAPPEAIGALVTRGPAGLLPFSRVLAPAEWRALRLRLKVEALGGNVVRALRTLDAPAPTVVVVGGPAGDDEVLSAVARALPDGVALGRGDVAGSLGHRYAVAYGLLRLI